MPYESIDCDRRSVLAPTMMAARNRPRGAPIKDDLSDAHEERTMWNTIVNDLRKLKQVHSRAAEVAKLQVDLEAKIGSSKCT